MRTHRLRTGRFVIVVALAALMVSVASPVGATDAKAKPSGGVLAEYDGRTIDLSVSWEGAAACHVSDEGAWCFDSEKEMRAWLEATSFAAPGSASRSSYCSGATTLYDGTWYSGAALSLSLRSQWLNLSNYGFNQRTSSFKIGPCSAVFADYANGGGARYPTYLTQAYDRSPSMISGWNNDVSSIYIY